MNTATLYLRQSLDRSGEGAAVDRQLAECREYCDAHGWAVGEVFRDNDTSATSGKARPGFEALLGSNPQRIVVWHVDRLVRLTKDLERVIELGVPVNAVKAGHVDLANPAGRAVARTIVAWAQYEGEQKGARQVAATRQRAQRGDVGWTRRPFGFDRESGAVVIVEHEAAIIRDMARRVLAGESTASLVRELNAGGVPTSTGARWTVTSLRRVLLSSRVAGRLVSKGVDYGEALHGGILEPDVVERLRALFTDPRRKTAPQSLQAKYLLSGIVRCGRCDVPMHAMPNKDRVMIYSCRSCHLSRKLRAVDYTVVMVLLRRLLRRDFEGIMREDVDLDALRARAVELRDRRDGIASMLGDGLLTVEAARVQARKLTDQIEALEREISAASDASPLAELLSAEDAVGAVRALTPKSARELVRWLMVVRILPAGKGVRFSPEQVEITWR
jgi:DNA invertase Pin-like site-specific DNA recombinase